MPVCWGQALAYLCATQHRALDEAVEILEARLGCRLPTHLANDAALQRFADHLQNRQLEGWAIIDRSDLNQIGFGA